ncbi:MAG: dTDP-4-dehydrorhamnose reductase [Acidobacteria bacterium]|nr:dTDP-4-dehydrorhamnose reductase [Acidobacteriota bacterium]
MTDLMVTGSEGQLGRALLEVAAACGIEAEGHDVDTLDVTDAGAVREVVSWLKPRVVVNCAAFTAVDACEEREAEAAAVNGRAVAHLAAASDLVGALLVQMSTDYVFSGSAGRPYAESDVPDPISAYGRSKLAGERAAASAREHLLVRTAWLFGNGGRNFVEAIKRQLDGGAAELRVVADQSGNPTYCTDLAEAVLELVDRGARGTVHVVNAGSTTWHGLATEIVRRLGSDVPVRAIRSEALGLAAARPPCSELSTARLEELLGHRLPDWRDALGRYLERACAR